MKSADIQTQVVDFIKAGDFNSPYGALTSEGKSSKGRPYLAVTFGRPRTYDATVEIYNKSFIIVRSSQRGLEVCRNVDELFNLLRSM